MQTNDQLIDGIYEAAAVPELWPEMLENVAGLSKAMGGILFATDLKHTKWVASPEATPLFDAFVRDGWMERNPRPRRLAALKYAGFVHELDVFTLEELDQDPVYQHIRSLGLGWAAGTLFPMPSGDLVVFSFERRLELGPVEREVIEALDGLRPHLGRAALLAWRLGLRRAQAMAQALETVGLPAAVLGERGRVYAASQSFQALMPDVAQDRRGRLTLVNPSADALLGQALERLSLGLAADGVLSIPLPAREERPAMVVHVLPIRRTAHDLFSPATTIVIITPVDRAHVPSAEVLEGLFDLTPAEARAARAIAGGRSIEQIAADGGLSKETVRTRVKTILAKTGLNRQAQLAALLAGSALPRARDGN